MPEYSDYVESLQAASTLDGSEFIAISQGGSARKITVSGLTGNKWRGAYDASVDAYPTTGGNGPSGAPGAGDEWYVSVAGDLDISGLGVTTVFPGAILIALVDSPGQTPANWKVIQ